MDNAARRVLIIESSMDDLAAFQRFYDGAHIADDISVAMSLEEAREHSVSEKYDVIICEYIFADGTAFDILKLSTDIPVIVCTREGDEETAVNLMKEGASDYIVKDSDYVYINRLYEMIDSAIAQRVEAEVSGNTDLYREIVNTSKILIWRTDVEGRLTFLNPAWERSCGYRVQEMIGRPLSAFQKVEAAGHYINEFRNCLIGIPSIGLETTVNSICGDEILLATTVLPLRDINNAVIGTQGTAYDITETRNTDELLQYITAKDSLTGLYNLHTFLSIAEQLIKTADREKKEVLFIYSGINNMKLINSTYGHDACDQIMIDSADIFRQTFREADVLSRTGGDEFAIATLVSSKNTEDMIMQRLKMNFEKYMSSNREVQVSLSYGTSFYDPQHPASITELLSLADSRMHDQKKNKRG